MEILTSALFLNVLTIATTLLVILVAYLKWCFTYWKRKGVYTLPPSIPFGNAVNLILRKVFIGTEFKNVHDAFRRKGLRFGGYYIFGKPIFVPVDLNLVKHIMVKDFDHFTDHLLYVDIKNQPLTGHLFALGGDEWKKLRYKFTPTFTAGKIKMMFQTIAKCGGTLVAEVDRIMREDKCIDAKDLTSRYTIDVIGFCGFGIECNSLKNPKAEFAVYCTRFFGNETYNSIIRSLSFFTPEMFDYIKLPTIPRDIHKFFLDTVKESVAYRELHNIAQKDFMHLLIQLKNNSGVKDSGVEKLSDLTTDNHNTNNTETPLTVEQIAAQCFLIFQAGFETTATTLTFFLYEMSENQELQEKVRDEINTVVSRHGNEVTYDAVADMSLMEMCINETLRKYPPVSIHTRACTKRYQIPDSDVVLEKGTFVFISTLGLQRDPETYPDPDKFDPYRFSPESKTARHPSSWIPFGDGPRICLGLRFGMVSLKVALTTLLKHYRFKLSLKTKTPLVLDPGNPIVVHALGGIWLEAEKLET